MPISYDYEDFGLGIEALRSKYPQGHPEYTIEEWKEDDHAQKEFTGYWDWVSEMIAIDDASIPSH